MDSLFTLQVYEKSYLAGVSAGQGLLLMCVACSVVLFISKTMR